MSNGSNSQYPSQLGMRRRSNTAAPIEGFGDLHHRDFVSIAGRVSRCKLDRLVLGPYQRAVLKRGVNRRSEYNEVENPNVLMGMEYAGSVGTMVIEELAEVNERTSGAIDILQEKIQTLEGKVASLEAECHSFRREAASLRAVNSECILQMAELMTEVRGIRVFQTSLQHGPGNPIVVEDDDEVVEDSEDGRAVEEGEVVWPDLRRVSPTGRLVEIEEDPRDPSHAVDRAMEREELLARRLTMDDQAWREAMETEQLARIDLVPGYIPPPSLDDDHYLGPSS